MNEQLDTILRDYKNGQKLDGSGDLYTIVDARQSLLQLIKEEKIKSYNSGWVRARRTFDTPKKIQYFAEQLKIQSESLTRLSDEINGGGV